MLLKTSRLSQGTTASYLLIFKILRIDPRGVCTSPPRERLTGGGENWCNKKYHKRSCDDRRLGGPCDEREHKPSGDVQRTPGYFPRERGDARRGGRRGGDHARAAPPVASFHKKWRTSYILNHFNLWISYTTPWAFQRWITEPGVR